MIPDANFTLAAAKAHLRVPHAEEDSLITAMLDAAVGAVERLTRRAWTERTWSEVVSACDLGTWCGCDSHVFHAALSPATAEVFDTSTGSDVALADVTYSTSFGHTVVRVEGWPVVDANAGNVGRLDYVAKPLDDVVPSDIFAAVMLILGDLYENREAQVVGTIVAQNNAVALLTRPYVLDMHV